MRHKQLSCFDRLFLIEYIYRLNATCVIYSWNCAPALYWPYYFYRTLRYSTLISGGTYLKVVQGNYHSIKNIDCNLLDDFEPISAPTPMIDDEL